MRVRKWLASLLIASLALLAVAPGAMAARQTPLDEAVYYLQKFQIVKGDPSGDLRLGDPITRAELIKIIVVAAGLENQAMLLRGARAFTDTAEHWSSGYVAAAKQAGITGGYPDGSFKPDNQVTNAEAIALLVRVSGIKPASTAWPDGWLDAAVKAGIVPEGLDVRLIASVPATRGGVFLLAHNAFSKVKDAAGKTLYQKTFDSEPPELTVNATVQSTSEASIQVTGQATGATTVTVNGTPVPLALDGSFSTNLDLVLGNNTVTIAAYDELGNEAKVERTVMRTTGVAARIEAPARIELKAGETKDLGVVVKDSAGITVPNPTITANLSGDISGTFANGAFTAGSTAGTGTLTLTAGEATATIQVVITAGQVGAIQLSVDKPSVAVGEAATVTAVVTDAHGNPIPNAGVIFGDRSPDAVVDSTSGVFMASAPGRYTVVAQAGGITETIEIGVYDSTVVDLALSGPTTIVGNDQPSAAFTVSAVDRYGNVVANAERTVDISAGGLTVVNEAGQAISSVTLLNGKGTFYLQADSSYWGTIIDIDVDDSVDADMADRKSVEIMEQVAAGVKVLSADTYLAANDGTGTASVKIGVVDQSGAEMIDGIWELDWNISGPATRASDGATSGSEVYVGGSGGVELLLGAVTGRVGDVTVSVSAPGLGNDSVTVKSVIAQGASRLSLGLDTTSHVVGDNADPDSGGGGVLVTVTVTDANGVPVNYSGTVFVDFSDEVADIVGDGLLEDGPDADSEWDDRVTLSFTAETRKSFRFVSEKAGTLTLTAKESNSSLASASKEVTFKAGAAAEAGFAVTNMLVPVTNTRGKAIVQVFDDFGNPVKTSGVSVQVVPRKGGLETTEITVNGKTGTHSWKTDENGQIELEFVVRPDYTALYDLQIGTVSGGINPKLDADTLNIDVEPTVASQVEVEFYEAGTVNRKVSAFAGQEITIRVTVKDQYGTGLTGYLPYLDLELGDREWSQSNDGVADAADDIKNYLKTGGLLDMGGGVYEVDLWAAKATSLRVTAKVNVGTSPVTVTRSLRVTAGDPYYAVLSEADFTQSPAKLTLKEGEIKAFTLRVADAWGNLRSAGQGYRIIFNTGTSGLIVRETASGIDLGGSPVTLTSSKTIYLLLPTNAAGGTISISDMDGLLGVWNVDVEGVE